MAFGIGPRKGGDPRARALRARKGHSRRRARALGNPGATHYKGSKRKRTKSSWFWG